MGAHSRDTLPEVWGGYSHGYTPWLFWISSEEGWEEGRNGEERKYTKQEDRSKKGHIRSAHTHWIHALCKYTPRAKSLHQHLLPPP